VAAAGTLNSCGLSSGVLLVAARLLAPGHVSSSKKAFSEGGGGGREACQVRYAPPGVPRRLGPAPPPPASHLASLEFSL